MGLSRRAFGALCFALNLGSPLSVAAAPKTTESNAVESARALFYRALALQDRGKWAEALALLEKVAETRESAQVRFNIAFNQEHLGRLAAAARGYERAIELAAQRRAKDVVSASHDRLGRLAPSIARLVVWPPSEGVLVALDGEPLEPRDLGRAVPVDVGEHVIVAEAPGHKPYRTSLSLAGGEMREIRIELDRVHDERPAAKAPPERTPAAVPKPKAPPAPHGSPPGARESKPSALPYIAGGAAVLSLVTAAVFYGLRQDALDTMRSGCEGGQCPEALRSTDEKGWLYTTAANVALATGIGLAGVSAGLFISGIDDGDEPHDVGIRASVSTTF